MAYYQCGRVSVDCKHGNEAGISAECESGNEGRLSVESESGNETRITSLGIRLGQGRVTPIDSVVTTVTAVGQRSMVKAIQKGGVNGQSVLRSTQ